MKLLELVAVAAERGASDLHLVPGREPLARVRGELVAMRPTGVTAQEVEGALSAELPPEAWARFRASGALELSLGVGATRCRAILRDTATGPSATLRLASPRAPTLEELGLPRACRDLVERPAGLVLVAGPAGGGRTSTLAAMVEHATGSRAASVLVLDAPMEVAHTSRKARVSAREIGADVPTVAEALRCAPRADADVVVVRDLRGAELAALSVAAGALVLAEVHASGAVSAVERLVGAVPAEGRARARAMLGEVLAGVVWQRLFRRLDGERRVAAHEVLLGSPQVLSAIREGKPATLVGLLAAGRREGMIPLDVSLEHLVEDRLISPLDAWEHARDKEAFRRIPAVRAALPERG